MNNSDIKQRLNILNEKGYRHLRLWSLSQKWTSILERAAIIGLIFAGFVISLLSLSLMLETDILLLSASQTALLLILFPILYIVVSSFWVVMSTKAERARCLTLYDDFLGSKNRLVTADEFINSPSITTFQEAAIEDVIPFLQLAENAELPPVPFRLIQLPATVKRKIAGSSVLILFALWLSLAQFSVQSDHKDMSKDFMSAGLQQPQQSAKKININKPESIDQERAIQDNSESHIKDDKKGQDLVSKNHVKFSSRSGSAKNKQSAGQTSESSAGEKSKDSTDNNDSQKDQQQNAQNERALNKESKAQDSRKLFAQSVKLKKEPVGDKKNDNQNSQLPLLKKQPLNNKKLVANKAKNKAENAQKKDQENSNPKIGVRGKNNTSKQNQAEQKLSNNKKQSSNKTANKEKQNNKNKKSSNKAANKSSKNNKSNTKSKSPRKGQKPGGKKNNKGTKGSKQKGKGSDPIKKSRGVASLMLGVPLPDHLKGSARAGYIKKTKEKATPKSKRISPLGAEDRDERTTLIQPIAHPVMSLEMQRLVKGYFEKMSKQSEKENEDE